MTTRSWNDIVAKSMVKNQKLQQGSAVNKMENMVKEGWTTMFSLPAVANYQAHVKFLFTGGEACTREILSEMGITLV